MHLQKRRSLHKSFNKNGKMNGPRGKIPKMNNFFLSTVKPPFSRFEIVSMYHKTPYILLSEMRMF